MAGSFAVKSIPCYDRNSNAVYIIIVQKEARPPFVIIFGACI